MASESVERYLVTIYRLEQDASPVTTSALAEHLGVSSPSVSGMTGKLADRGLVTHEPYKGIALTAKGEDQALALIRLHRLWERFLVDVLGLPWDQVHDEACRLEHVTSPLVEERLARFLSEPETCPHGYPVPTADGERAVEPGSPLAELAPGQSGRVQRVPEGDDALLRYLASLGLEPRASVQVEGLAPFQGPLTIRVGEARHAVSHALALKIVVEPL